MTIVRRHLTKMLRKKLKLDTVESAGNLSLANQQNHKSEVITQPENDQQIAGKSTTTPSSSIANNLLKLELDLNKSLKKLTFKKPVEYVYCPLDYAYKPHSVFTQKYCKTHKKILILGMNPGPWGMSQTGIPFGEINIVKDWFQIDEEVSKPEKECHERKVLGLACPRSEVSGKRIWGLFRNICGTPENFFKSAYMYNYCPIAMMDESGRNITPAEMKDIATRRQLEEFCDETLYNVIQLLQSEIVLGVGKFAEKRALNVLKKNNPLNTKVFYILHPSPLAAASEEKWLASAEKTLNELKLMSYFKI